LAEQPAAELRGRGWTLSVQRLRSAPEPGRSSNLGAAALAVTGSGRGRRVAVRLAEGERLWLSVTAPPALEVAVRTPDGRTLADERLAGGAIRRFARIEGSEAEGVGKDDVPLGTRRAPWQESLSVTIGGARIPITLLRGEDFDAAFGPPPSVPGEPAVYEGWRLP
jgi:hypothetical protein